MVGPPLAWSAGVLPLEKTTYLQSVLSLVVSTVKFQVHDLVPSQARLRPLIVQSGSPAGAAETAVARMAATMVLVNCILTVVCGLWVYRREKRGSEGVVLEVCEDNEKEKTNGTVDDKPFLYFGQL